MKFYLYQSIHGEISLYGAKGYTFFHVEKKNSYDLLLDEPRISYDFVEYGWKDFSSLTGADLLRDLVTPYVDRYGTTWFERIRLEEIQRLIEEAR